MKRRLHIANRDPLWDELVFLPAQLARPPLFSPAEADLSAVIGKNALIPLKSELPFVVSHMSFGSVSAELKCLLAKAAAAAGVANGSGEGGVLIDEMEFSSAYIYEYTPGLYGLTPEVLQRCGAVEIKIGRSLRGGLGEPLPEGLEPKVYHLRNAEPGAFFTSPGRFAEISSPADLRITVDGLREGSGGKPIGIKLAAGSVEADLAAAIEAGADFVTLDGRSTFGSGALDGSCLPTLYAVCRARSFLEKEGAELDIIAAGGMRTSADFAKALALGASAVASASAVLEAAAAVNGELTLTAEETEAELEAFFAGLRADLSDICAFTGRSNISELCPEDLAALSGDAARFTGLRHV